MRSINDLPLAMQQLARQALASAPGGAPSPGKPAKSARQKPVVVKALIFCRRCGSYKHETRLCLEASLESDFGVGKKTVFAVPVRTTNPQNGTHGNWAPKSKKRNLVKQAISRAWKEAAPLLRARYRITLTRISSVPADKHALHDFLKSVVDQCAAEMKIDDASPLVEWVFGQEPGEAEKPAVRIEVEELP